MNILYPVYEPFLSGNEEKYVIDCLTSGWISSKGRYVDMFENSFSKYIGIENSIAVTNGTTALHLALLGANVQIGDEVLVQTFTYVATVNAILYCGAKPVFVDSKLDDWQINIEQLANLITPRTKAIIVAHLYGGSTDMIALKELSKKYGICLIEDCAESLGTKFDGKHLGTFGDISTFSFFGNKTLTTGEGGMVVTADFQISSKMRILKGQGLSLGREYWHDVVGYNYRMTNICAALGVAQLEKIEEIVGEKKRISFTYRKFLNNPLIMFPVDSIHIEKCEWMVSITVPMETRDGLRVWLASKGIETRPFFYPVHEMPMHVDQLGDYPNAEILSKTGLNLPSYPALTNSDIEHISNEVNTYLNLHSRAKIL